MQFGYARYHLLTYPLHPQLDIRLSQHPSTGSCPLLRPEPRPTRAASLPISNKQLKCLDKKQIVNDRSLVSSPTLSTRGTNQLGTERVPSGRREIQPRPGGVPIRLRATLQDRRCDVIDETNSTEWQCHRRRILRESDEDLPV